MIRARTLAVGALLVLLLDALLALASGFAVPMRVSAAQPGLFTTPHP